MCDDGIEEMVEEAHSYFNENSIHEVIDMDRDTATQYMNDYHENPNSEDIEQYLSVVVKLRKICDPDH